MHSFPPHVTLVGGLQMSREEALAATGRAAEAIKQPYTLQLDHVTFGSAFYMCVFVKMVQEETVMAAGRAARVACGQPPDAPYTPHLSLLYASLSDEQKRQVRTHSRVIDMHSKPACKTVRSSTQSPPLFVCTQAADAAQQRLFGEGSPLQQTGVSFPVRSIVLWATPSSPGPDLDFPSWYAVAEVPLANE
jgi:hypothetical protein